MATYTSSLWPARSWEPNRPARSWGRRLVEGLPQGGCPPPGDPGLDQSDAWGRTYWGGALFYAQADVRIRRQTSNRLGLIDALRGILAVQGGNNHASGSPAHTFAVGDALVGVRALEEPWAEMGSPANGFPTSTCSWKQLGVPHDPVSHSNSAPFDDKAHEASITQGHQHGAAGTSLRERQFPFCPRHEVND